jgi:hypothetical protein
MSVEHRARIAHGVRLSSLILATILLSIPGCGRPDQTDEAFTLLDRAAAEVDVGLVATVVGDTRYGAVGISSDPPTRRLTALSFRSADELRAAVEERLASAGFVADGGTFQRGTDTGRVTAFVAILGPADALPDGSSAPSVPAGQSGVVIRFVTRF